MNKPSKEEMCKLNNVVHAFQNEADALLMSIGFMGAVLYPKGPMRNTLMGAACVRCINVLTQGLCAALVDTSSLREMTGFIPPYSVGQGMSLTAASLRHGGRG